MHTNAINLEKKIKSSDIRPYINVKVSKISVTALIDSGSEISAISKSALKELSNQTGNQYKLLPLNCKLVAANGEPLSATGKVNLSLEIPLVKNCRYATFPFIVCQSLSTPMLIGANLLTHQRLVIDCKTNALYDQETMVVSAKTITVPPMSERLVPVSSQFELPSKKENLLMDTTNEYIIASISKDTHLAVCQNFTNFPLTIEKNEILGNYELTRATNIHNKLPRVNTTPQMLEINKVCQEEVTDQRVSTLIKTDHLPEAEAKVIRKILDKYSDVFSLKPEDIGYCDKVSQNIVLKDPNNISCTPPYRIAENLKPIVSDYVDKLLRTNIIQRSTSPFCSPLLLVRKAGSTTAMPIYEQYRVVHDYRKLNANTVRDSYPLNHVHDLIDKVASCRLWSVIDLSSGFWNQNLAKEARPYTAFAVPGKGHFEYTRTAQGLCNSPAAFQRLLDFVVRNISNVYVYIDDVVIATTDFKSHIEALKTVFDRFRQYNLKCRPKKVQIATNEINYLGFNLTQKHGIRPGEAKIKAIQDWQPPKTIKEIRQFLGLCSFFRRSIQGFSDLAQPLTKLTRKDSTWKEGPLPSESLLAFKKIKSVLINRPCLTPPNFNKPFILTVDASKTGIGAILSQSHDSIEHPVAYGSKTLTDTEKRYAPFRLEYMALVWGIKHFSPYLLGRHFTVRTDHKPLLSFNKVSGPVYDRYLLDLSQYDFKLEYLKGEKMPADGLSRLSENVQVNTLHIKRLINMNWIQLKKLQQQDKQLKALAIYLQVKSKPNNPDLRCFVLDNAKDAKLHEGVLVTTKSEAAFAPLGLRSHLIKLAHDSPTSGHYSAKKTLDRLQSIWYWPEMTSDINSYCRSCPVCLQHVLHTDKPQPLMALPPSDDFNCRVHVDLFGPLIPNNGYKYCMVIIDAFSKFLKIAPLQSKEMEHSSITFYNEWVSIFGPPHLLISDLGKEFNNSMYKTLCDAFGITHHFSSPAHPISNGQAETAVKESLRYIRKYITDNNDWIGLIQNLQLAHNTSQHTGTKRTPYSAVFLRDPLMSYNILKPGDEKPNYSGNTITHLKNRLVSIRKDMWTQSEKYFETMKKQYDKRSSAHTFQIDDKVFLLRPKKGPLLQKFQPKFEGPYLITSISPKGHVILQDLLFPRRTRHAHINNLKLVPFLLSPYRVPDLPPQASSRKNPDTPPSSSKLPSLVDVAFDDFMSFTPDPSNIPTPAMSSSPSRPIASPSATPVSPHVYQSLDHSPASSASYQSIPDPDITIAPAPLTSDDEFHGFSSPSPPSQPPPPPRSTRSRTGPLPSSILSHYPMERRQNRNQNVLQKAKTAMQKFTPQKKH